MAIVYRHRRLDTNKIFYVGVGVDYKRAFNKRNRSNYWKNIVSKTNYEVEIIQENLTQEEAFELEVFLINLYGRIDLKNGILCNLTDGGEGRKNIFVSLDTRLKLSKGGFRENKLIKERGIKKKETRFQKVIDTETNVIYDTIVDASIAYKISLRHLKRCLYGDRPNYTSLKLLNEKMQYKCRKN